MTTQLTDRERALLAFEADWARHTAGKEEAIRQELGLAPARYYQLLYRLVDSPSAAGENPILLGRLRRLRDAAGVSDSGRVQA